MADSEGETLPTVALSSGEVDHDFKYFCLTLNSTVRIQVIAIAYIDNRLLVAVPHSTWHKRTASRRVLPGLTKPQVVEVGCVEEGDRSQLHATEMVKLWVGFLPDELIPTLTEDLGEEEFQHLFLDSTLDGFYPSGAGLVAAATEHFAFQSATGEEKVEPLIVESGSHRMESRLGRLEALVGNLASKLDAVLKPDDVVQPPPKSQRPSALRKSGDVRPDSPHVSFPTLDPSVVASAVAAGVDPKSLQEMEKLLQEPTVRGRKSQEPVGASSKKAPSPKQGIHVNVLSESEDEADAVQQSAGSGDATPGGHPTSVEGAVVHLAQIVQLLTSDKLKRQKASKVETALDGVSASGVNDSGSIGSGKKTAAARRALRAALQENPEEIVCLIERLMSEDLSSQTLTPGQPIPTLSAKAWVEHRSRIGHWKSSAYTAWTVASALDSLRSGNVQGCRARLNLMLLMLDQTACDRGSWTLSAELSLEQGPPMNVLQTHSPPSVQDGDMPFSRLLDPRWAEVAMAHVRDTEEYLVRRSKLGRKDVPADGDPSAAAKAKAKAKAKGGGNQNLPPATEA